jgi:hypothetical protein
MRATFKRHLAISPRVSSTFFKILDGNYREYCVLTEGDIADIDGEAISQQSVSDDIAVLIVTGPVRGIWASWPAFFR